MALLTQDLMPDLKQFIPLAALANRRESYWKGSVVHINRFCPPNASCFAVSSLKRRANTIRA